MLKLKLIFTAFLLAILAATGWASLQVPIFATPRAVVTHPWFIATLVDTYLGFFTFWLWLAYKERSKLACLTWLLLICALGNIAMASYVLMQLWRLPHNARIEDLLLRKT